MQRGRRQNKEVGTRWKTDRNKNGEKERRMLRLRGSERLQMIASQKVVFYTASDLLSIYGDGY